MTLLGQGLSNVHLGLYVAACDLETIRSSVKKQLANLSMRSSWDRAEVEAAWRNVLTFLNGLAEIPKKGLLLLSDSQRCESIEPPFRLDPPRDRAVRGKNGLILIGDAEATIAWFMGDNVVPLWHDFSGVMVGDSAQESEREEQLREWQRKVAEWANGLLALYEIKETVVGGPGLRKREMIEDGKLRIRVIGVVDSKSCDYTEGPSEALDKWKQQSGRQYT